MPQRTFKQRQGGRCCAALIFQMKFRDEQHYREMFAASAVNEHFERCWCFNLFTETVGEYELLQMNLFHYNTLRLWNSPFLPPFTTPQPKDIWEFLWLLSPDYQPGQNEAQQRFFAQCRKKYQPPRRPRRWQLRFKFFRSAYKARRKLCWINSGTITEKIRAFVKCSLADRPPAVEVNGIARPEYYSDIAAICAGLAREYGGGVGLDRIEHMLRVPLKIIFQFKKETADELNSKLPPDKRIPLGNPSDEIKNDWLIQCNSQQSQN